MVMGMVTDTGMATDAATAMDTATAARAVRRPSAFMSPPPPIKVARSPKGVATIAATARIAAGRRACSR